MFEDFKREIVKKYINPEEGITWSTWDLAQPEICMKECELQIEKLTNFMNKYPYDFRRLICFASDMLQLLKEKPELLKEVKNLKKYDSFCYHTTYTKEQLEKMGML